MNSPVRLGVSPATASTPTGVFGQMFEALFSRWSPALWVCLASHLFFPVYPHANVGLSGLPAAVSSTASASHCLPMHALSQGCPSLPLLLVWMNVSLTPCLSDFHTVPFSGNSGWFLFLNWSLSFFWLCKEAKHF